MFDDVLKFDILDEPLTKHLAGKHDQSSHAGGKGKALDVSRIDSASANNLVSASPPHVGLSDVAQEVASRISPAKRTQNFNDLTATAIYTDKLGNKYQLQLDMHKESYKLDEASDNETTSVRGTVTYEPINQPAPSIAGRYMMGEPNDTLVFDGAAYTKYNGEVNAYVPAIIESIDVSPEYRGRGIATAMLEFARRESGNVAVLHSWNLTESGEAFARTTKSLTKHLAGKHDQRTHGGWSDPSIRRMGAGNGLSARQIFDNQAGQPDNQVRKIYNAEARYAPQIVRVLPEPIAPKRADFPDSENYSAAWNKYSTDWDDWSRESSRSQVSETAQQLLDGSNKGVSAYFDAVTGSEWFKEEFGNARPLGVPKFSLVSTNNYSGQFAYGFKNGSLFSTFKVNKGMSQNESTILHEIAHYATAISTSGAFESHGGEFARNYIFMTRKVMGDQAADQLANEFEKEGVKIGN